jgi:hypothetical protein
MNVNDNFGVLENSWWRWANLVAGAHRKVAMIGLYILQSLQEHYPKKYNVEYLYSFYGSKIISVIILPNSILPHLVEFDWMSLTCSFFNYA